MPQYIANIELLAANNRDLEILRQKMLTSGFHNYVKADNGVDYQLPAGSFVIEGNYSLTQVYELAERATRGIRRESYILVVMSRGVTFKLRELSRL